MFNPGGLPIVVPQTINVTMKTRYGLEFKTLDAEEIARYCGYDRVVAECHIANCGNIITLKK